MKNNQLTLFNRREPKSAPEKPLPRSLSPLPRSQSPFPRCPLPRNLSPLSRSLSPLSRSLGQRLETHPFPNELVPPPSKATRKRHLTGNIGNESKKRAIVIKSDKESGEDDESGDPAWVKIALTSDHRADLLGGKWLNDCHIDAAQQLINLILNCNTLAACKCHYYSCLRHCLR